MTVWQIGTCDRCGRPVMTDEGRHLVNGLYEHDECPLVSRYPFDDDPAA